MKSYPRTKFDIVTSSANSEIATTAVSGTTAIMMQTYTSDKGSEDWELLYGITDFTTRKGGLNFTKHGQPQFTVANLLTNGSYVLAKRLVADDATLANTTIRAKVVQVDNISYLYLYGTSAEQKKTFEEVCTAGYNAFDSSAEAVDGTSGEKTTKTWDVPLFTIAAVGRGKSNITFRLEPQYYTSRSGNLMKYNFTVYEGTELLESILCTFNPDAIIDGTIQSIQNKVSANSGQVRAKVYEDGVLKLAQILSDTALDSESKKINIANLINLDIINGVDKKENAIGGIVTMNTASLTNTTQATLETPLPQTLWGTFTPSDITPLSISYSSNGIPINSGSNGALKDAPIAETVEYKKCLAGAFGADKTNGNYSPIIYDVDRYKVDAIFDCAYPMSIKKNIINLVDVRGDCVFIADLCGEADGTDGDYQYYPSTKNDIIYKAQLLTQLKSKYTAIYHNSFDIVDIFTKKQIKVTMPYLLAPKLVAHISSGVGKAFAGIPNNLTFPEIIESTVNFLPIIIPDEDQKQDLADACVNYISYYDNLAVMESMWTTDDTNNQLSYLHNVMAIQEIIKVIRSRCPKTRYTFMDEDDLETYLTDIKSVVKEYSTNFKSIDVTYMADSNYESNNVFYAAIKVRFNNFVNEEYFKIIAID